MKTLFGFALVLILGSSACGTPLIDGATQPIIDETPTDGGEGNNEGTGTGDSNPPDDQTPIEPNATAVLTGILTPCQEFFSDGQDNEVCLGFHIAAGGSSFNLVVWGGDTGRACLNIDFNPALDFESHYHSGISWHNNIVMVCADHHGHGDTQDLLRLDLAKGSIESVPYACSTVRMHDDRLWIGHNSELYWDVRPFHPIREYTSWDSVRDNQVLKQHLLIYGWHDFDISGDSINHVRGSITNIDRIDIATTEATDSLALGLDPSLRVSSMDIQDSGQTIILSREAWNEPYIMYRFDADGEQVSAVPLIGFGEKGYRLKGMACQSLN